MKKTILLITLFALALAACAPSNVSTSVPVENDMPVPEVVVTEMVVEPQGKLPAPSFESQTYLDEIVGFAVDYPVGWIAKETMVGDRGSQTVLLSSPTAVDLETLPEGVTRVAVNVNQWDPKNDLTAFVASRKTAWESSGFTILEEEALTLDLGLAAVRLKVQSPDGLASVWLMTAIGEQYVTLSGEGDLALALEIMQYLRPINQ